MFEDAEVNNLGPVQQSGGQPDTTLCDGGGYIKGNSGEIAACNI